VPVICRDFDVLFNDVPGTGGSYTARVLSSALRGEEVEPKHRSFRRTAVVDPPSIRVFTLREPLDWYRSYWSRARASIAAVGGWPITIGGDLRYPTRPLDERCGHDEFEQFVRNVLREFPDGFLRALYCDYLNGATHVLRYEHLDLDLAALLRTRGIDPRTVAFDFPATRWSENWWGKRARLPRHLGRALREVENLDGLDIPYLDSTTRPTWRTPWTRRHRRMTAGDRRHRSHPARTRDRPSRADTRHADHL
jgi:hypothetical protein